MVGLRAEPRHSWPVSAGTDPLPGRSRRPRGRAQEGDARGRRETRRPAHAANRGPRSLWLLPRLALVAAGIDEPAIRTPAHAGEAVARRLGGRVGAQLRDDTGWAQPRTRPGYAESGRARDVRRCHARPRDRVVAAALPAGEDADARGRDRVALVARPGRREVREVGSGAPRAGAGPAEAHVRHLDALRGGVGSHPVDAADHARPAAGAVVVEDT